MCIKHQLWWMIYILLFSYTDCLRQLCLFQNFLFACDLGRWHCIFLFFTKSLTTTQTFMTSNRKRITNDDWFANLIIIKYLSCANIIFIFVKISNYISWCPCASDITTNIGLPLLNTLLNVWRWVVHNYAVAIIYTVVALFK